MKKIRNTAKVLFTTFILTACTSAANIGQPPTAVPTLTFSPVPSAIITQQSTNTSIPEPIATPHIEPNTPIIQFREYNFPEYEKNKVNQNGVFLNINWGGIYAIDTKTVFLFGNLGVVDGIGHRSLLLRSIDGGRHWQEINIKQVDNTVMMVAFVDNGIGWALSAVDIEGFSAGNLYRSSDFGETWSDPIAIGGYEFHPWGMKFTDKNNGYIKFDWIFSGLDDHMGILSTTDGGITWKETLSIPVPIPKDKDVAKYNQRIEQAQAKLREPTGGDYGSYWNNYWDTKRDWKTHNSKGHDGSEWIIYYYEPTAVYIILQRSDGKTPWAEVSTIPAHYTIIMGKLPIHSATQHSVHPTCGSLRDLQAFFWLRVYTALRANPRPPTRG